MAGHDQFEHDEALFEDSPSYTIFKPRHDPNDGQLKSWSDFLHAYDAEKAQQLWTQAKERSPPFLETKHRLGHGTSLDLDEQLYGRERDFFLKANSSAVANWWAQTLACVATPLCGPCIMRSFCELFEVPAGHVQPMVDGQGGYLLAGQGVHYIKSPYIRRDGPLFNYSSGSLTHGDWGIVVIDQGFIGLAMDKGQPVLLPPGFHQWKSTTLKFVRTIDLNEPVIYLGPYTLLTVDEGYCAVTQNNGRQEVKRGGETHLLMHRNHKFEKFLSMKIQTDNLARIEVITADNVLMVTAATVNWRIADPELAARNAAETMKKRDGGPPVQGNIAKLRNDVLQQASASLSSFIGTVNYSDSFSPTAQVHRERPQPPAVGVVVGSVDEGDVQAAANSNPDGGVLFNPERMLTAVEHANNVTHKYGVDIISINIISAKPSDPKLMNSLAQGAVAAAEAQQQETTAQGRAKAARIDADADARTQLIEAESQAEQTAIVAQAQARAREIRAQGAQEAAQLLATNPIAVELSRIEKTGEALGNSKLFFGADGAKQTSLLANPAVVRG